MFSGPPSEYWPMCPSVRTTRWHGTRSGTGLWPSAVPTARTAAGWPISDGDPAVRPDLAAGDLERLEQTARSNSVRPRRSTSIFARRSPASRRAMALARRGGSASTRRTGRPKSRSKYGLERRRHRGALATDETPRPFQATKTSPIAVDSEAYRSARPTAARVAGRSVAGALVRRSAQGGLDAGQALIGVGGGRGHAIDSWRWSASTAARSNVMPRWTWALTVPSGRPRTWLISW